MVHTVNDIMRDLGVQFVRVMPEHIHFGNGNQPRFLKFMDVVGNSVKCSVDAVQRMVNAQFVKLSNSHVRLSSGEFWSGLRPCFRMGAARCDCISEIQTCSLVIAEERRIRPVPKANLVADFRRRPLIRKSSEYKCKLAGLKSFWKMGISAWFVSGHGFRSR